MGMTFEDLKKMAEPEEPEEVFLHRAAERVRKDERFAQLERCKNAKDFMGKLEEIFSGMKYGRISSEGITAHTIAGICQIAHEIRDEVGPANRKSFQREAIPWLLRRKERVMGPKPPEEGVIEYMCRELENRYWPEPSNYRPEAGNVALPGLSDWFRGYSA